MAVERDGVIRAESGFLAIPEDQAPEVFVYQQGGIWLAERGEDAWEVRDQAQVSAGGRQWVLHLPEGLEATWAPRDSSPLHLAELALRFAVSTDEEHVVIYAVHATEELRLPGRAHDYLLLTLAAEAPRLRGQRR